MSLEEFNIIVAGVGGQGNIRAARYLAEVAIKNREETIVGETFGASQRGGSVRSHVRFGVKARSPLVPKNKCNLVLGLEPLEAVQCCLEYLAPNGLAIVNTSPVFSTEVKAGKASYPQIEQLQSILERLTENVICLDATAIAQEVGNTMAMNTVILGALSSTGILPMFKDDLKQVVVGGSPKAFKSLNEKAFQRGLESGRVVCSGQ